MYENSHNVGEDSVGACYQDNYQLIESLWDHTPLQSDWDSSRQEGAYVPITQIWAGLDTCCGQEKVGTSKPKPQNGW